MAPSTVSIYITDANGKRKLVASNLSMQKFKFLSDIHVPQKAERGLPGNAVLLPQGLADEKAAVVIVKWIASTDLQDPRPLSPGVLRLEKYDEILQVYATAHALRIKRLRRGDEIRDMLYEYMHQGPLTFDEFAMTVDYVHEYDPGLAKTAMHCSMFNKSKGGARVPPEMGKIESWSKEVGIWDEMVAIEKHIIKMKEKDKADAEARRAVKPPQY